MLPQGSMATLTAYFDESSDGRVYTVSGFVTNSKRNSRVRLYVRICPAEEGDRAGKQEFTRKVKSAARDLSAVTDTQVAEVIRAYRSEKKQLPEITVAGSKRSA